MIVELTETGRTPVALGPGQGRRLAASGLVTAVPSTVDDGMWEVSADRWVGVARVGDVELVIRPKLPIDRLLFLVGYAKNPAGWRDETVGLDTRRGLVAAIAQALWRQAEHALRGGLLHGYRVTEETSTVLRGRLREADQLRRHPGRALPLEIRHDDYTADVPENRILLAAITRMLRVPRLDAESRRRLDRLRVWLADASPVVRGMPLPAWQPTRLNARYHNAVRLAEIVWLATAPEHARGATETSGFLFDLPRVFEDFVTVALSEHLAAHHVGTAHPQYRCHLDEAAEVAMRPDLVWQRAGQPVVVVDAKYKQERPSGYPDADLYQMLAYCTALGLPRGHLVYAAGTALPARHVVRHARVEIHCHALDLSRSPAEILARLARIGDELLPRPLTA